MSVILQISDPHFGTEQAHVVEALATLVQQQQPALLLLSGDITQRARTAQFQAARNFIVRLRTPALAVPCNHDIPLFNLWARLRKPYAGFSSAFGDDLEPVHRACDLLVVCANTTPAWRHKHGEISERQVDRVARVLDSAQAEQLRVVMVHQPVAVMRPEDLPNLLRGHAAALQHWAEAGVDLVAGGHIHLPYVLALPDLARPVWAVQGGTAVSTRMRDGAPNSLNVLRWGRHSSPGCCQIEQWDFLRVRQAFVRVKVCEIRPERA